MVETKPISPFDERTVVRLAEDFRACLFDDYLPFISAYIYDEQHGGFLWNSSYRGETITTHKRTWYDARGVWVYANLYTCKKEPAYLEKARKTLALLQQLSPDVTDHCYPWSYNRQGRDLKERSGDLYGNLFVAEAYIAYGEAVSEGRYLDQAKRLIMDALQQYAHPDYRYQMDYAPSDRPAFVPRVLGHWMIFLRLATSFLRVREDVDIQALADRCITELLEMHLHQESGLLLEVVTDQTDPQSALWSDFVYLGHAIESLWMLMDEAVRRQDTALFQRAADTFQRHINVAWDPVYGGFFHSLESVRNHRVLTDKVLWAQHEALLGCLLLWEQTASPWAAEWVLRIWSYLTDTFRQNQLPYRPWRIGGNRRLDGEPAGERIENYHHPRLLMAGIGYLETIKQHIVNLKHSNDEKRNQ